MKIYRFHYTVRIDATDYIFLMSPNYYNGEPRWYIQIYHADGGFLEDMYFSDCSPRTAWKAYYHMVRRHIWYENGR